MMETFTLRVPPGWQRSLDSSRMRAWLADYLRQPGPLPLDPGPGDARVSLSLPRRPVKVLAALLECSVSASLRRLSVGRLQPLPPSRGASPNLLPGRLQAPRRAESVLPVPRPERPAFVQPEPGPFVTAEAGSALALQRVRRGLVGDAGADSVGAGLSGGQHSQPQPSRWWAGGLQSPVVVVLLVLASLALVFVFLWLLNTRWVTSLVGGVASSGRAAGASSAASSFAGAAFKDWVPVR